MSLNVSLGIAERALQVNQYALNVVSNNIANMNTEGYSKKTVQLEESYPYKVVLNGKQYSMGTGVQIADIVSQRSAYFDDYFRSQSTDASYYSELANGASTITNILNELGDTSLQKTFEDFYNSFETLATNPANSTYRLQVIEKAKTLVNQFNNLYKRLMNERNLMIGDTTDLTGISLQNSATNITVNDINTKLSQITQLNNNMLMADDPTSIIDARNMLLDELAAELPITTQTNLNGTISVYLGNQALIQGNKQVGKLELAQNYTDTTFTKIDEDNPIKIQILDMDGNIVNDNANNLITSSKLGAYLTLGSTQANTLSYNNVLKELNLIANTFATSMNNLQLNSSSAGSPMAISIDASTGKKTLTPSTKALFAANDGTSTITAGNITLNPEINDNYNLIAAARVLTDSDGNPVDPNAIGNSNNALLMADDFDASQYALGGVSINTYYNNMITKAGAQANAIDLQDGIQGDIVKQINTDRVSIMGVNLDEELADMIKYQRAYEAAARIFTAASEMMQLLTRLGQ